MSRSGLEDRPPCCDRTMPEHGRQLIDDAPEDRHAAGVGDWGYIVQGLWDPGCDDDRRPVRAAVDRLVVARWADLDATAGPGDTHRQRRVDRRAGRRARDDRHRRRECVGEPERLGLAATARAERRLDGRIRRGRAGDTIVAVGAMSAEDGSGRSAILVATPRRRRPMSGRPGGLDPVPPDAPGSAVPASAAGDERRLSDAAYAISAASMAATFSRRRMPRFAAERRAQERDRALVGGFRTDDPRAHRQHVHVVVLDALVRSTCHGRPPSARRASC